MRWPCSGSGVQAAVALVLVFSCSTDENPALLRVHNATPVPIVVYAFPGGSLIDPVPILPQGSFEKDVIAPLRWIAIDSISGYTPGEGISLFVYAVQSNGAATFSAFRSVSDAELRRGGARITIDALPEATSVKTKP